MDIKMVKIRLVCSIYPEKCCRYINLGQASVSYTYSLAADISPSPSIVACIAIIKRPQPIDPAVPIQSQLHLINLPGIAPAGNGAGGQTAAASPPEILHSVVHLALAPYFDAYTKTQHGSAGGRGRQDAEAKTGVPVTKKRIAELELSLLHLQQNIEIPELMLPLNPVVQNAIDDAEARRTKASVEDIPPTLLQDSTFLNNLQTTVNNWIKSIQAITKMSRDPKSGTATQEINFWLNMETALEAIEVQLRSDGVLLTLEILRHAKRFQATVSFSADTGLKEATDKVQKYNQLMRDFPLDELLSATSLPKVQDSIGQIFTHLTKKLRICPYPIHRALPLVEAISADLDSQLHDLINGRTLMHLDYREFQTLTNSAEKIWRTWDENIKEFTNVAREVTRRRNEKFIPIKIIPKHADLQARLKYVSTFRDNHEQLQRTIVNVLGPKAQVNGDSDGANVNGAILVEEMGDVDAVEEVQQAYAALKNVDLLDVTPEGTQFWVQAEITYNERTSRVENSIIARLRDRLATAKNANEMFRVFSKFNALFVRPKIRGAITEYQTQLIENVKQDISALHERFKQQYGHSEAHAMAQLRDLPPVSGAIIWARQIERQLNGYMKKVEDVLGHDWVLHSEGQKLQSESNLFRKKLDTRPIYDAWLDDQKRRNISIAGRLFNINKNRAAGYILELAVNFDPQVIALFKETRNLTWLNYQVPHSINNVSKEAKRIYPYAVSLMESVRILAQTNRQVSQMSDTAILLSGYQNDVQVLVSKGVPLKWESFVHSYDIHIASKSYLANGAVEHVGRGESKHVQFIRDFAAAVAVFQNKTVTLSTIDASLQRVLKELETCPYDSSSFQSKLETIQMQVDQLNLENYVNLSSWVQEMNKRIENTLLIRLRSAIGSWIEAFEDQGSDGVNDDSRRKHLSTLTSPDLIQGPTLRRLVHEISMRNQIIYLDPPLEYARASWFAQLHDWLGVVCNLRKVRASRYEMRLTATGEAEESRFTDLPVYCADSLLDVYTSVESKLQELNAYIDKWLQFQSLWDLQSDEVYSVLGEQLSNWLQLLQEIRKTRSTFDTTEVSRSFGHIKIDYEQVQTKVNAKYDQWQHEILTKFAARLGDRMRDVYTEIQTARRDLEAQSLEASSTAQAVQFITIVQTCKRKLKAWGPEVDIFRQGQTVLVRQRHVPTDWLDVNQIDSEWAAFNEILARKAKIVQDQTDALRAKITAEDKVVGDKIAEIINQWNEEKPVSGTIAPEDASATLASFESRVTKLHEESEMVAKAKEALDIPASPDSVLAAILEEVQDFKSVWAALSTIWKSLNDLRESLWNSVQPRKLRSSIDGLIKMTKEMPSRMRQYAAFEHIQNVLRQFLKANSLLTELKSEAVRDRHWNKIFKSLKPGKRYSPISMTLGDVWDLNLAASEVVIRDIIIQAQGEMALEEFLKQVRETWTNYSLELVNYQNKCRLIRGWDDLFAKCGENLNSLQAMRHSPYFKEFEEEASSWEDKLNRVHLLFDVWIDVQRQWVYLEGVFTGNADIKHLLPIESARFQNINSEFFAVMKKVYKQPFVLDVLNISGVQKSLERLAELLSTLR